MPAGDGIYQTVGWLFTATDLATPVANAAQKAIDVASRAAEVTVMKLATTTEKATHVMATGISFVENSFKNVFGDFWTSTMGEFGKGMTAIADRIKAPFLAAQKGIKDFATKVGDSAKSIIKFVTQEQLSFSQLYKLIGDGTTKALTALKGFTANGIEKLTRAASTATVQAAAMLRNFNALEKIKSGLAGLGSIFTTAIGGPLGLVLKLLQPLLNMIEKALTPAFETFSDILENAFAPLSFVAETVARDLAPLLAKFLTPLVGMLTAAVAKGGMFLKGLLDTGKATGPLVGVFGKLQGSVSKVFDALVGLASKIIPVVFKLVEKMLPIVVKVVEAIANLASKIIPTIGKVIEEFGPILVDTFAKLLDAVTPILPPLVELAGVLAEKVFAPLLIVTLKGIVSILENGVIPFINKWLPAVVELITEITDSVSDFYGNFGKNMKDFYVLFIQPMIDGFNDFVDYLESLPDKVSDTFSDVYKSVTDFMGKIGDFISSAWDSITDTLGFDSVGDKITGAFGAMLEALQAPIDAMKSFINTYVIGTVEGLLTAKIPLIGTLGDVLSKVGINVPNPLPRLEKGGIITKESAYIGAEGNKPEAVLPLNPDTIERAMPALSEIKDIAGAIYRLLSTGVVNVRDVDGKGGDSSPAMGPASARGSSLDGAVGIAGIVR